MTKNEILTNLFNSKRTTEILKTIAGSSHLLEDLQSELFIILCEMPEDKIIDAHNKNYIYYLVINILKKQFHSSTSPFFYKFSKVKNQELGETESDSLLVTSEIENLNDMERKLDKINTILEDEDYIDRELFKLYYKIGEYNMIDGALCDMTCSKATSSYRKIAKKLAIGRKKNGNLLTVTTYYSHKSITNTLNNIKRKLKL
jgi:hypothetical protein